LRAYIARRVLIGHKKLFTFVFSLWYFPLVRQKSFVVANAYLFTALATYAQVRLTKTRHGIVDMARNWDACASRVVFSGTAETAKQQFETWMHLQPKTGNPRTVVINKIFGVPFTDKLLTESGISPLNWPKILSQVKSLVESTPVDHFEEGYWVDVNQVVRPDKLSFSAGTLESEVPEDIRSGLNWSSDKKFLFMVSALATPMPQPVPGETDDEDPGKMDPAELANLRAAFPIACDKEAVALVQARNSVIAAWLWRTYAAKTRFAANRIRIDPWPGKLGLPENYQPDKP
jgi:hypothetical protein